MINNEREQSVYDLGWLVGFFVGEGCFCISGKTMYIDICQKEKYPLLECGRILNENNICDWSIRMGADGRNIHKLMLNRRGVLQFAYLLKKLPLYSNKREDKLNKFISAIELYLSRKTDDYRSKKIINEFKPNNYEND